MRRRGTPPSSLTGQIYNNNNNNNNDEDRTRQSEEEGPLLKESFKLDHKGFESEKVKKKDF